MNKIKLVFFKEREKQKHESFVDIFTVMEKVKQK